jgi:hypothetical protein
VLRIVHGHIKTPPGFTIEWFKKCLGQKKHGKTLLAETLLHHGTHKRAAVLGTSPPDKPPQIPPVDATYYGFDYKSL